MRNRARPAAPLRSRLRFVSVLFVAPLLLHCQRTPRTVPAVPAQSPLLQLERPRSPSLITGTVAEVVPAGAYFYARLATPMGEAHWIASLGARPQPGESVSARVIGTQRDFFSRRLGRRFATVHFAWLRAQ